MYVEGRRDEQPERRALCPRVEAGRPLLDALAHLPPVRAARAAAVVVGEPRFLRRPSRAGKVDASAAKVSKDGPGRAVERKSQNEKLQKIEQQKELEAEERRISNQKAAAAAAGLTHEELAC